MPALPRVKGTGAQVRFLGNDQGQWISLDPWVAWNQTYTTTATMATINQTYTTNTIDWLYQPMQLGTTWTVTANTSYADEVYWTGWNNTYRRQRQAEELHRQQMLGQVETDEQRAEREARRAEREAVRQAEAAKQAEQKLAADSRARELLLAWLDDQQKLDLAAHGWFEVISNNGRRWRIRTGDLVGNVDLMPEQGDTRLASYCAHPPGRDGLPFDDHHLAQKLVLEAEEERFLNVAYLHYRRPDVRADALPGRRAA